MVSRGVREARKQLVVTIEKELENLERTVAERLVASAESVSIPVTDESDAQAIDVEMEKPDTDKGKAPITGYDVEAATESAPIAAEAAVTAEDTVMDAQDQSAHVDTTETSQKASLPVEEVVAVNETSTPIVDNLLPTTEAVQETSSDLPCC